jgi:hypothetical protein
MYRTLPYGKRNSPPQGENREGAWAERYVDQSHDMQIMLAYPFMTTGIIEDMPRTTRSAVFHLTAKDYQQLHNHCHGKAAAHIREQKQMANLTQPASISRFLLETLQQILI